jgi:hypothetical protein
MRDTQAPSAPGSPTVASVAGGGYQISWEPASDNAAVVAYRLWRDGELLGGEIGGHSTTDYPPAGAGIQYAYRVTAYDAAGNSSSHSEEVTATNGDTSPPSAPNAVQGSAGGPNQISLSWSPSADDVGVAGYAVYRDGALIAVTGGTTLQDRALSDRSYIYTVSAYDAAGNYSPSSDPVTITTPSPAPIAAIADTYVKASSPASKYGSATVLRVDADPQTNAYLKFEVTGVSGPVARARLRVYVSAGSSTGFAVRSVADSAWSEATMTWTSAPAIASTVVASSGRTTTGTWVTLDVTAVVAGNGTISIALTSPGTSLSSYGSRESATPPQLLVDSW